jgi:TonB-dependent starch-binding outer membrane protein SusC
MQLTVFKFFLMVKLTALFLFLGCLQLSANSYGQGITLSKKNATLPDLFLDIYRQSGYYFIVKDDLLEGAKKVNIVVRDATLKEVLDICFQDQPLEYTISDHVIVVRKKQALAVFDIIGKVTNEKGEPMEGAAVIIKGTKIGTQTNAKGTFELKTENSNIELEISYTGYQSKSIKPNAGEFINVQLFVSTNPYDQVQIIAYGTTSKRLNTGDISTVTAETIAEQPVSNPLAALEGRVSGLVVTEQTGVPGGSFTAQIRGQNSIFSGNNPFYIVDGVPFTAASINSNIVGTAVNGGGSPMNSINPSDIESITILKDADATAIYGSRGANGVILITTKKGKAGKTNLDLNVNTGVGEITRLMPMLNTKQYVAMREEAFANDGAAPDPILDHDLTVWDTARYTNWQKELIGGQSSNINAQASLSGGSANTQFIASGSYYATTTVFPGDFSSRKISGHLGLTQTSTDKKFQLTFSGNYIINQDVLPVTDPSHASFTLPPNAPAPFTPDHKLNWDNGYYADNPYQNLLRPYQSNTTNFITNAVMSYELVSGLSLKANLGYTKMQVDESSASPVSTISPSYGITNGSAFFASHNISSWILEPQLEYRKKAGFGNFNLLAGLTFLQNLNQGQTLYASGYTNDALLGNIAGAGNILVENSTYSLYKYAALFARIHYEWQEKYIVNITGRRDGSSRFGPGKEFADFGAIGVAWLFTKEKGVTDLLPLLSFGKIRGSYGLTGNDQIGDYQFLETWSPVFYPYQGISGLQPTSLANPSYGWETNKKTELAMDLGFWSDRVLISALYFLNHSSNQLIYYPLPGITGFTLVAENSAATVQNNGFELELNSTNIKSSVFSWQTLFNISIPKNILVSYPNLAGSPFAYRYAVGQPLSVLDAYHYTGVNTISGLYNFEAKDPNNPIYPDDLHALKNTSPIFYGGFQNTLSYKNWHLDIFFQFVKQNGFNYLAYNQIEPGMYGNQPTAVLSRWQQPGDQAPVEKYSQNFGAAYNGYVNLVYSSDGMISDASYIRLKNLSLSYNISGSLLSHLNMRSARIYLQGQNLITITHYLGPDPENQSVSALPPLKILTAGIQCSF